jgi:ubiquitin-like protein Pup
MAAQESTGKRSTKSPNEHDEERTAPSIDTSALDADVDAILDEIDEVLEENAEDFVKSFVQKGGQ